MRSNITKIILLFMIISLWQFPLSWGLVPGFIHSAYASPTKITGVSLVINYGEQVTQNNLVVLQLSLSDNEFPTENTMVQFSVDNKKWYGYQNGLNRWIENEKSPMETYYANFNIGNTEGKKTVHVRLLDENGNVVGQGKSEIFYSPVAYSPMIEEPISRPSGGGTLNNPYFINKGTTLLDLEAPHSTEVTYSRDGTNWLPWSKIRNSHINKQIWLDGQEGLEKIYVKTKNQWGIESTIKTIYYYIDKTSPEVKIIMDNGSSTNNGRLDFEVSLYDSMSSTIDFEIVISGNGMNERQQYSTPLFEKGMATTTEASITSLPTGTYQLTVKAYDQAGNLREKSMSTISKN